MVFSEPADPPRPVAHNSIFKLGRSYRHPRTRRDRPRSGGCHAQAHDSSYYSDYTFGVWSGNEIVPIGNAYFGFTDAELRQLDKWIRSNTTNAFGPVREVSKQLVFEVAFDSAQASKRHKSGVALRFPRINRIRWDKPASEAATLDEVTALILQGTPNNTL